MYYEALGGTTSRLRHPAIAPLLLLSLFVVGLAIRLVALSDAPLYTDEMDSIRLANDVSRGRVFPLTDQPSTYYGPLHVYLLAPFFWIGGHSFESARLLIALLGALTPLATFWLVGVTQGTGEQQDIRAPLLAAGLMLTSASHVAIDSHIFWPTSLAPLMLAVMLGCYVLGLREGGGRWLICAGLFAALLLYSSPHAVAGLPGLALHYLSDRSRRRSLAGPRLHPWPYLGATAFCVAYLPLVLYNLLTGGDSIASALHHTGGYAFEIVGSPGEYLLNIRNLLTLLVRVVGSNLSLEVPPVEYFQIGLGMLLLTGGIWYSAMRDRARPHFCVVASTVLLMPVFNKGYYAGFPIQNRYLATLLPACFCLMSLFLFDALVPALKTSSQKSRWGFDSVPGRLRRGVLYLVLVLLAILPLRSSAEYYRNVQSSERSNLEAVRTIEDLARRQPPPSIVVLDPAWEQIKVGPGNDLLLTARTWLELKDRAYNVSR